MSGLTGDQTVVAAQSRFDRLPFPARRVFHEPRRAARGLRACMDQEEACSSPANSGAEGALRPGFLSPELPRISFLTTWAIQATLAIPVRDRSTPSHSFLNYLFR